MEFNRNRINILVRILLLTIGLIFLIYSVIILQNPIRSLFSLALCVAIIIELLSYTTKLSKDVGGFLEALYNEDFTNYYSNKKHKNRQSIYDIFNRLNSKYKKIAIEKEVQHALLQTIMEHISIGIIVINSDFDIHIINRSFKNLLSIDDTALNFSDALINYPNLKREFHDIKPGESRLIELVKDGEILKISITASYFKMQGISYKLFSLQNINQELDEQEIIAWQKIIRVLTHEIMNSVTPISSLTSSLNNILIKSMQSGSLEPKHIEYLSSGLEAVQERSQGLMKFTELYKTLTHIPQPDFKEADIGKIIDQVYLLFKKDIDKIPIQFELNIPDQVGTLLCDKSMIEQVLINIIKNAIEALNDIKTPILKVSIFKKSEKYCIQIQDNGHGIPEDKIDKIFIPFFTTKEKGSGIGLSFARQVMRLHKGSISVKSSPKEGTTFTLKF